MTRHRWAWASALVTLLPAAALAAPAQPELAVLERTPLQYPRLALCEGTQGTTRIRVEVDRLGTATQVSVAKSSGSADLDGAALASVRGWRFSATGEAASGEVSIVFALDDLGAPPPPPPGATVHASSCRKAVFSLFGGLVGLTPQYQPFTLEVGLQKFPADADVVEVIAQDATGQNVQSATLRYDPRHVDTQLVRFEALKPGQYQLLLIAGDKERGRSGFVVTEDGSVETSMQKP